jgi:hypothetical protein
MNQELLYRPLAALQSVATRPDWRRQWPAFAYAFALALAAVLFIPVPEAGRWLMSTLAVLWRMSGGMLPLSLTILAYVVHCGILLASRRLTTLHIDRLQLAEHFAYSSGILGVIIRLVTLSHTEVENFDPRTVLGAIAPFEIGFSLWALVVATRWLAEHIAIINSKKGVHEN